MCMPNNRITCIPLKLHIACNLSLCYAAVNFFSNHLLISKLLCIIYKQQPPWIAYFINTCIHRLCFKFMINSNPNPTPDNYESIVVHSNSILQEMFKATRVKLKYSLCWKNIIKEKEWFFSTTCWKKLFKFNLVLKYILVIVICWHKSII